MTNASVRTATLADSESIATLMTQLDYPSTAAQIRDRLALLLDHPEYAAIVAEISGEVAGLVLLHLERGLEHDAPYGRVMGLVVGERWRRAGLGRLLMQRAEGWCEARGANRVVLTSASRRTGAHDFYRRIGYHATGVRFAKHL